MDFHAESIEEVDIELKQIFVDLEQEVGVDDGYCQKTHCAETYKGVLNLPSFEPDHVFVLFTVHMFRSDRDMAQQELPLAPEEQCHDVTNCFIQNDLNLNTVEQCEDGCEDDTSIGIVHQAYCQQELQG